jgi:hypothetical protein
MKPISPEKVQEIRINEMPEAIIQAVNELIVRKWNGHSATIKVKEIVEQYFRVSGEEQTPKARNELFENHHLDIEPAYRNAGWKVEFDNPAYNEDYDAYFVFTKKK